MAGIYLASFKALHSLYDIKYQDINGLRDIPGDMMTVDLSNYEFIIASPPCNYWSKANYRRDQSEYALNTRHLLPSIIKKLVKLGKPFIVENVVNQSLMGKFRIFDNDCYIYFVGRHTYFTNVMFNPGYQVKSDNVQNKSKNNRQGDKQVHDVIEYWLKVIHS